VKQHTPDNTFDGYSRRHTDRALDHLADDIAAQAAAGRPPIDVAKDIERRMAEWDAAAGDRWDGMS
jgi:hypothetical protein